MTTMLPRSQEEIVAHYETIRGDDLLGFKAEVLLASLDYEHARPYLRPDVTPEGWDDGTLSLDRDSVWQAAAGYLDFAWGKAAGHRGISAERSVEKLAEYAWLLGRDDVVAAMGEAGYAMYGVPKLVAFAEGMGLPVRTDCGLDRMAQGDPCGADYDCGCRS